MTHSFAQLYRLRGLFGRLLIFSLFIPAKSITAPRNPQPGFLVGTKAEKLGTVRAGSRLACIMYESQIPIWSCVVRKGYGVATGVLLGHQNADFEKGGTDQVVGWISAEAGGVPVEGWFRSTLKW